MRLHMANVKSLVGICIIALAMVGGVSSSASAGPVCAEVTIPGTGRFKDPNCFKKEAPKEYIFVNIPGKQIKSGEVCAEVSEAETGTYKSENCSGESEAAGGKFIKVHENKCLGLDAPPVSKRARPSIVLANFVATAWEFPLLNFE